MLLHGLGLRLEWGVHAAARLLLWRGAWEQLD